MNVCYTRTRIEIHVLPVLDNLVNLLYNDVQVDPDRIEFDHGIAYIEAKYVDKALEFLRIAEALVLRIIGEGIFDIVTVIYEYSKSAGHDRIVVASTETGKRFEYQDNYPDWMKTLVDLPTLTGLDLPKP